MVDPKKMARVDLIEELMQRSDEIGGSRLITEYGEIWIHTDAHVQRWLMDLHTEEEQRE